MEPVNIGIITWARGLASLQMLPVDEAAPIVNDTVVYKRWTDHWTRIINSEAIETRNGKPVSRSAPEYVDEILKTQKGNYILIDGGEIVDRITAKNISDATSYLYDELVKRRGKHQPTPREQAVQLKYLISNAMKESGVAGHDEFQQSYPVSCKVGNADIPLKVHYAIGNGKPRSIFQRVQIGQSQSVYGASFVLEHIAKAERLPRRNCAALVYAEATDAPVSPEQQSSLAMLGELATVINLWDQAAAKEALAEVASAAGGHS